MPKTTQNKPVKKCATKKKFWMEQMFGITQDRLVEIAKISWEHSENNPTTGHMIRSLEADKRLTRMEALVILGQHLSISKNEQTITGSA